MGENSPFFLKNLGLTCKKLKETEPEFAMSEEENNNFKIEE